MRYQVRSAARCIEVLEYFHATKQPARAKTIGGSLGLSPSTTSDLLKTMVEIGYLSFDERTKTYFPGIRAGFFANWLTSYYSDLGGLTRFASELRSDSGECIVISAQKDNRVEFLLILDGPEPTPANIREGSSAPIIGTAAGGAILMRKRRNEIVDIIRRTYRMKSCEQMVQLVSRDLRCFWSKGYATLTRPELIPGFLSFAIPLAPTKTGVPLALGIGGPEARMREREGELMALAKSRLSIAGEMSVLN